MVRSFPASLSLLFALPLCACATAFDGRPQPVISTRDADVLVKQYPIDTALKDLKSIDASADPGGRNSYRNRVIAVYLTAMDAHYGDFVRGLSQSGKGLHIGLDSAVLLLTGTGAMFKSAASDLAAAATAVGGVRGSVDRELFADKTLPILISLMNSRRLAVRADILRGQSEDEGVYTVEDAFSDLARYEAAGTIDSALSDVVAEAGAQAKEAQRDFTKAKELCVVSTETSKKRRALMKALEQYERDAEAAEAAGDGAGAVAKRTEIQKAAIALGNPKAPVPADKEGTFVLLAPIRDQVEAQCESTGVEALATKAGVKLQ